MKRILRKMGLFLVLMALLIGCLVTGGAAEEDRFYFLTTQTANPHNGGDDGGWYVTCLTLESYGEHGIEMTANNNPGDINRCLWVARNNVVDSKPFLIYEFEEDGMADCQKITLTRYWGSEPEVDIEVKSGPQCISLLEVLADQETIGWTYITPYVEGTARLKYMYLSDIDLDGNIYEKPTQPAVPNGNPAMEIRYPLAVYETDTTVDGYGFLKHTDIEVLPGESGAFRLRRVSGSQEDYVNIAWVVPYEQLEKTPYLVVDIGNEGRPDEGPQVLIYAYWEHVVGSGAYFDAVGNGFVGSNGLNGENRFNLKYAVDNVKESLHGEDGIAIIIGLDLSKARTDGTALEPLQVNNAYLLGYEPGGEDYTPPASTAPTSPTGSENPTTIPGGSQESDLPMGLILGLAGGAVVVAGAVAAVIIIRKKKKS